MVDRYKFYRNPWGDGCDCEMDLSDSGGWVEYDEYKMLLDKYNDLKTHLEGLSRIHQYEPSSGMGDDGGGSPGRWPDKEWLKNH